MPYTLFMRSLHDVHEMNAYRAGHVHLSSVRPSPHDASREPLDGRIWMKFGMYVLSLEAALNSYF
jgi:hypothetical protein